MSSEDEKERRERLCLMHFLDRAVLSINRESIRKVPGDSQPDFACRDVTGPELAFEITVPHGDGVGKAIGEADLEAFWTGNDDIKRLLQDKLDKQYNTSLPIDLVCCWWGRVVDTDEGVLRDLLSVIDGAAKNPYRRIWYDGEEKLHLVYERPASSLTD